MVSATGVSTSRRLAPGAMAWEYSTSSVVSSAQLTISELFGLYGGTAPSGWMIWKDGGAGSPKVASKVARSLVIVGDPNESIRAIVFPVPVRPRLYKGRML